MWIFFHVLQTCTTTQRRAQKIETQRRQGDIKQQQLPRDPEKQEIPVADKDTNNNSESQEQLVNIYVKNSCELCSCCDGGFLYL